MTRRTATTPGRTIRRGDAPLVQVIRLPYSGSYDWTAALTFLERRAIDGVEDVSSGVYRRTVGAEGVLATMAIEHDEARRALVVTVTGTSATDVIGARVRRMFDVDADAAAIAAHLRRDPEMASLMATRLPLRVFRGWDGFEVAARSIIGQQVSVERARRLNGVLVERCGERSDQRPTSNAQLPGSSDRSRGEQAARTGALSRLPPGSGDANAVGVGRWKLEVDEIKGTELARVPLTRFFPTPRQVVDADLSNMGMPGARVAALKAIAEAAIADPALFERAASLDETIARLLAVRGIGPWTAHYIAMRACGEADAFPASDIGLLRGARDASGRRPTPAQLQARAERWRPWRAYAAHYLWARD
ncbi:MAG: DNA-3-methyladenine glycosylase family protein [Vicinamibacterales bacterium]